VFIDKDKWIEIFEENGKKLEELVGTFPFNPNAPAQVKEYCNNTLKLKIDSTGARVITKHAKKHQILADLLSYRKLEKRRSTYGMNWIEMIEEDGRIYSSWDVNRAESGRVSSSNPNLQNIPVKGEWGRRIRETFIAEGNNILLSADYSQIELRILAHLSNDEGLINAFKNDLDIHARTASEIFGIPIDQVTQDVRRIAKTVNFGIIYGISPFGLSATLKIPRDEAKRYIEEYDKLCPKFKEKACYLLVGCCIH